MTDDLSLNPHWRRRVREIGRMNFTREEMIRLGFYSELESAEKEKLQMLLDEAYPRLSELKKELKDISSTIDELDDVQSLLKEVRRKRIERVKQEREQRRAKKVAETAERKKAWAEKKAKEPPFLGVGVSDRLQFSGGDENKIIGKGLPFVATAEQLATLMEISNSDLLWLCYERGAASVDHYTRFEIPKRSGGRRLISSPKPKLRIAQQWVLKNILEKLEPFKTATAFRPGKSILDNAEPHLNAEVIIRMDFKDFFPLITFPRVRGFFEALGYNPGISSLLALICTDAPRVKVRLEGKTEFVTTGARGLPQGACTSPSLANLIAWKLDARISGFAEKSDDGWVFTRYADDLTISTKNPDAEVGALIGVVKKISASEGFVINEEKTKVMRSPSRRVITGLIVDKDIRLSRKDLRNLRAFLHRCDKDGLNLVSEQIGKDALSVARGRLAFVQMVMPEQANALRSKYSWL